MAGHGKPPFRADHVGSLLRPKNLLAAREKMKKGALSAETLKTLEDEAIREVVKLQEEIGLHSVTDGDFRRDHWWVDFVEAIDGVAIFLKARRRVFDEFLAEPRPNPTASRRQGAHPREPSVE